MKYKSTKKINLGSCCFRQPKAVSHCKYLHGYDLNAKLWFEASKLDKNGWVMDFGSFKGIHKRLNSLFDHTLLVANDDPELYFFIEMKKRKVADVMFMDAVGMEAFAKRVFEEVEKWLDAQTRVRLVKVEVWEHDRNSAIYEV